MPRQLRIEYPGAIYHLMNRGDRREPIFKDDADRVKFLNTLAEACAKTAWQVHAYCLMGNHFHLVLETPEANLVAGMKWFLGTYTARFNRRHRRSQETDSDWKRVRRGWCLGEEAFGKELLAQAAERMGENHYGAQRHESSEAKAARIVSEELKRRAWTQEELRPRAKGDVEKVLVAQRLRQETTVSLKWIAQQLEMGSWTHVANRLCELRQFRCT